MFIWIGWTGFASSFSYYCAIVLPHSHVILIILIGYMIFLLPFLGVMIMSLSIVSFLTQLDSGILCLQTAFIWSIVQMALSLKLIDTFIFGFFLNSFPVFFNFFFSCISMPFSSCSVLQKQKKQNFFPEVSKNIFVVGLKTFF